MRKLLLLTFLIGIGMAFILWNEGTDFIAPENHAIDPAPTSLAAESVSMNQLHGWFVPGAGKACVLLLHGIRADRTRMTARAAFLKRAGYASLLIDFQAHGESPGQHITFGYRESENVKAAVGYLRQKPECRKVAIIGTSLGGAASLLGPVPAAVDAFILEGVYPTIEEAVSNRLVIRYGRFAPWIAPLFLQQIPLRLNIPLSSLRPIDAISRIHAPLLLIAGDADLRTKPAESLRLYQQANIPKQLWLIPGAAHVDLHGFAGKQYEQRILSFLSETL